MMGRVGGALVAAVVAVAAMATAAKAQDAAAGFPNKPLRVIVPFAAGGGNDIFARLVGNKLSEILGQPVINENKPGAGGRIAAEYVMNQPHDGYTLFIGASGVMSIAAAAYPNLSYHPTKTFIPLTMIANFPLILVVPPDHPAKNVKEMVEWAKKNPDKANYASTSPAFTTASELLKLKSGMPGQMIPYKSSNEMILSVIQGQTLFAISDGPPAIPQIKAGKLRAIGVTSPNRMPGYDIPTFKEQGYDMVVTLWFALSGPANLPSAITEKMNAEINRGMQLPETEARLRRDGLIADPMSVEQFNKFIDAEVATWKPVMERTGLIGK